MPNAVAGNLPFRLTIQASYCSPILVWEELRLRSTGRFRIYEAYFRLGFGSVWRFLSGGALPQAEINEWGIL